MKTWLTILVVLGCGLVQAGTLLLKNGTELHHVTIISADPEQMLIVHDGGGCQVKYSELAPDSLSTEQRSLVETLLKKHVERQARLEELRIEKEVFEKAQLEKGLVLFEGNWMSPEERQQILTLREAAKLERERMTLALEKQKLELQQAELKAAEGDRLLGAPETRSTFITYTGRNWSSWRRYNNGWFYYGPGCHVIPGSVNKVHRRSTPTTPSRPRSH